MQYRLFILAATTFASFSSAAAACGGNDSSESLPRYTPAQSDWSPTCANVADHTPPPTVGWDKATIYNPVTSLNLDEPRDESVFYSQMCPKNSDGKRVLRGLRQRFDEVKPFADTKNPTKAEVDRWNGIVLTHIRSLAGIDHEAQPDVCLMTRALWANQWRHTKGTIWGPADATNPNQFVCPKTGSNMHCGASFVPNTLEKQRPYLPSGHGKCSAGAGSEGAFGHNPNSPWSLKTAEVFCSTLKAEGYWGGHTGPFWGRKKFGFGFWHDGSARFKWGGDVKASIYDDPRKDMFTTLDGLDATCESKVCADLFWPGVTFDTAAECREYVLGSSDCSNAFFTYNQGNRGCGCYPPGKTECGTVQGQSSRNTFFLAPVDEAGLSQNLGPAPAGGPYHATTAGPPSPDTITITQAGGFQWSMASDADGVVDSSEEHFPTLTIKQGTVVNFVGKVEKTHSFSVRSSDSGAVVVGPSDVAGSDAGVEYDFTWTASNAGTFEYFCEPHQSFMKGTIIVVEAPAPGASKVKSIKTPKWKGQQCGNKIKWLGKSCNRQMCLEMILSNPDCDDKYMLLNVNDGNSCACYPPEQAEITEKDCIRSSGREFYDIVDGCSGIAGENAQLDACGVCNGNNECFGTPPATPPPVPTSAPTTAPTTAPPTPAPTTAPPTTAAPTAAPTTAPLPPHDQSNCPHGDPAWGTCWANSAFRQCTDGQSAYDAVMDGNSGDPAAMYAKYAELMQSGTFGCSDNNGDCTAATAELASELAAEKIKAAALEAEIRRTKAELDAAQSCKAYTQKGRRSFLAP